MLIRPISDIHLEFYPEAEVNEDLFNKIVPPLPEDKDTVLVIAGDLVSWNKFSRGLNFIKSMSDRFLNVIYTPGNHEYYNGSIEEVDDYIESFDASTDDGIPNVYVLPTTCFCPSINGVEFTGGTLWTNYHNSLDAALHANYIMNDFNFIKDFTPFHAWSINQKHKKSIKEDLIYKDGMMVVVTHHSPSLLSTPDEYQTEHLTNLSYHNSLEEMICKYKPDLWIHGHTHTAVQYEIGDTKVICNPRGYYSLYAPEDSGFNPELVIEI